MTNRTGKREREARNRERRGLSYKSSGVTRAVLQPLKLGRKKRMAFSASTRFEGFNVTCINFRRLAAVPVAEPERR